MRSLVFTALLAAACQAQTDDSPERAETAAGRDAAHAAARTEAFLENTPGVGPGFAAVAVTADETPLMHVRGVRRAAAGESLTPDTPIYIASQTKAYVGLLAAVLDARGVLDLDDTLADHWPDLDMPGEAEAADITLRDLLSHQIPIRAYYITGMEAFVTRLDPAEYPALIEAHGAPRAPGFAYDNLGYNIYGAILEIATGRTWQTWLDEVIFDPLGMENTSATVSDLGADAVAWSHQWMGEEEGWHELGPKTDAQMQSAGGIYTSPADMAVWLQVFINGRGPEGSGIGAGAVEAALALTADTRPEGHESQGFACHGYSLGWNVCAYGDATLYLHGGGYPGARTTMAVSPELGVGFAAFANSDNMTGWLTRNALHQFLEFLVGDPDAEENAAERAAAYPQETAALLRFRREEIAEARAEARWGGWEWTPGPEELDAYVGTYAEEAGSHPVRIEQVEDRLVLHRGSWEAELLPARRDLFAAQTSPVAALDPAVRFERGPDGGIVAVELDGSRSYSTGRFIREN